LLREDQTFVLMLPDGAIGDNHTLSSTAVKLNELPADMTRRLPRYPLSGDIARGRRQARG